MLRHDSHSSQDNSPVNKDSPQVFGHHNKRVLQTGVVESGFTVVLAKNICMPQRSMRSWSLPELHHNKAVNMLSQDTGMAFWWCAREDQIATPKAQCCGQYGNAYLEAELGIIALAEGCQESGSFVSAVAF